MGGIGRSGERSELTLLVSIQIRLLVSFLSGTGEVKLGHT